MRTAFFYSLLLSCAVWACQSGTSEKQSPTAESVPDSTESAITKVDTLIPENPGEDTKVEEVKPYTPNRVDDVVVLPGTAKNSSPSTDPTPQARPVPAKQGDAIENNSQGVAPDVLAKDTPPSHEKWQALLQKFVDSNGKVNYQGLAGNKAELEAYLQILASTPVQTEWSRKEKLAYWINAYNAFTIKLILDNYPTSSITNLHGGKPWDVKWIKLGDKTYSLNNIENDIIRPQFKEPRIHFAVNCAAKSCPPLLNQAWTADNLERYLEGQTRQFINNAIYNQIKADAASISKIFDWYAADFGDLTTFINRYSNTPLQENAKIDYLEYDWALNK
ncbi:MAG TPA: DUF547 domain-containing protein [Saprospiraceae bacterium]|nr:DUF547 domain-containing protein [Saprospiraceae bacterium]HMQ85639.1 DUF547 domain-containing protein [Saprospiraceae bacterium]